MILGGIVGALLLAGIESVLNAVAGDHPAVTNETFLFSTSSAIPLLPEHLLDKVQDGESRLDKALEDLDTTTKAEYFDLIKLAEELFQLREHHQGTEWWETVDARWRLTDIRAWQNRTPQEKLEIREAHALKKKIFDSFGEEKDNQALSLGQRVLAIQEAVLGPMHPDVAISLLYLAEIYKNRMEPERALTLSQRALEIQAASLGRAHPNIALSLSGLARLYQEKSQYSKAVPLAQRALRIQEATLGPTHPNVVSGLIRLSLLYRTQKQYAEAVPLALRALRIQEATLGPTHSDVALSLNGLVILYLAQGQLSVAVPLLERALRIQEATLGPTHPELAMLLNSLARLYREQGQYADAVPLVQRALRIQEGAQGPTHSEVPKSLNELALLHLALGQAPAALPLLERALTIQEEALGPTHRGVALSLNNLAKLYEEQGQSGKALPLLQRALAILETNLGPTHRDVAMGLNNLAQVHQALGKPTAAEPLLQRALAILETTLGPSHQDVAIGLSNLASLYYYQGQYGMSLPLLQRAVTILEVALGPTHPVLAVTLDNLSQVYQALGKPTAAEPLLQRALAIRETALGPFHQDVALSLNNLAGLYHDQGQYARVLPLLKRALAIWEQTLGFAHPHVAAGHQNLAEVKLAQGQDAEALSHFLLATQAEWRYLTGNFATLSLQQKQHLLGRRKFFLSQKSLSHILQTTLPVDPALGFQMLLYQKQLLFEATRQERGAMLATLATATPEWRSRWGAFHALRQQYSTLTLQTLREPGALRLLEPDQPNPTVDLKALAHQIEQEEQALRQSHPAYAQQARLREITLEDVRQAVEPGQAVVEYVRYVPFDFRTRQSGPPRYGAFVLVGDQEHVHALDLGEADGPEGIDAAVQGLRAAMVDFIHDPEQGPKVLNGLVPKPFLRRSEATLAGLSSRLRDQIWHPLEAALAGVQRVYIAPDGLLSVLPFDILAQPNQEGGWRYLVEDLELIYLNTSRDLARFTLSPRKPGSPAAPTAVLISNPAFDATPRDVAQEVANLSPPSHSETVVQGTAAPTTLGARPEATLGRSTEKEPVPCQLPRDWGPYDEITAFTQEVAGRLLTAQWEVEILEQGQAVEERVLALQGPRLLQFTTHGLFLECPKPMQSVGWDNNPLLRSMLILAGVNEWDPQQTTFYQVNNRLLTAAEVQRQPEMPHTGTQVDLADGWLTAYDVTGMNLQGTELVNLTACETGLGEVTPDGVMGLRHAFLTAGARAVTMSLWEVPVMETTEQIQDFYTRWLLPLPKAPPISRYQAFRAAQLAALAQARDTQNPYAQGIGHPFFWAGSIYVGDPGDVPMREEALPLPEAFATPPPTEG